MDHAPARRSIRLDPDEAWEFVTDAHTGIFTTLRRDGMPIALPVWFAVIDRVIYTRTRDKKLARIANDHRASLLVEAGERWAELRAVHLTGRATIITPSDELISRVDAEMDRKYAAFRTSREAMPESARKAYAASGMALVELVPDGRILSWDNRRLGAP